VIQVISIKIIRFSKCRHLCRRPQQV